MKCQEVNCNERNECQHVLDMICGKHTYVCEGCTEKCLFDNDDMIECPITHNYVDNWIHNIKTGI